MRGKLDRRITVSGLARITPAHAGKTCLRREIHAFRWDHPRRCGENYEQLVGGVETLGSPPQVRGKQRPFLGGYLPHGITPAGAGKTHLFFRHAGSVQDHPRRCGENWVFGCRFVRCLGSPPQVRGKHLQRTDLLLQCRITPAGAGKTGLCLLRD